LSRNSKKQFENNIQNTALDNKIAVLCFRIRAVTKEIIVQKQIAAAKESFVAQKLQLQNITIDNIYMSASIVSVNLRTSIDTFTVNFLFEFNSFVAIFFSILRCYLNNIFYSRLNIKNIIKFTVDLFSVAATNAIDSSDTRNFLNLFCAFDIYIFIAFSFVLYLTVK